MVGGINSGTLKKFLGCAEIVLLQKTWAPASALPILEGFKVYNTPAIKIHNKGRSCGGLVIAIKNSLQLEVELIPHDCENFVLPLLLRGLPWGSLLCLNVYLPPNGVNGISNELCWGKLPVFLEGLVIQYPNAHLILGGDFNSRIGSSNIDQEDGGCPFGNILAGGRSLQDPVISRVGDFWRFSQCLTYWC